MDIETQGLGAGSYPEPKEEKLKRATGKIVVTYRFDEEFPITFSDEDIEDYIEHNASDFDEDYVSIEEITIVEE